MRSRILLAILSVTAVALLLFGIPLAVVVARFVDEAAMLRVERQAVLAARDVPGDFGTSGDPVELAPGSDGVSLALYDAAGRFVTGIGPRAGGPATMRALGNHVATDESAGSRIVAVPVTADERIIGVIRAAQSTSRSDGRTRRIVALLGAIAAGVIAVGAAIGYAVAGRLARPVRRLRDAAVQLGDGDFTVTVRRSAIREVDEAGQALTLTARRLDDLMLRERAFSADASHQLRTPLSGLRVGLETELAFPRPDSTMVLRESLEDIARLERTITELLAIARTPDAVTSCSLTSVLAEVASSWHGRFAAAGRPLVISDPAGAPMLTGNGALLRHTLDVLLDNALVHGSGETTVRHDIGRAVVTISVADEGPGFAAETQLESAYGSPADDTHGLGLPLAKRLVEALPGRLHIVRNGSRTHLEIVVGRADRELQRAPSG